MAKTSAIQRNLKRIRLNKKFQKKRDALKKIIRNKKLPLDERFAAQLKLTKLPKNSSRIRIRNRCEINIDTNLKAAHKFACFQGDRCDFMSS